MKVKKVTPKVIATVWRHWVGAFRQSKVAIAVTFIVYSLSMYFDLMFKPIQWKNVFDNLSTGKDPWGAFSLVVVASVLSWACSRIGETAIVLGESRIIKNLKDYCMRGLLGKNTHFFSTQASGALVAKWKRFASASEPVIDEFIFSLSRSALLAVYMVLYMSFLIPELAVAFFIWIMLFVGVTVLLTKIRIRHDLASAHADSVTTGHASDILQSVFTLRMFAATPRVVRTFEDITLEDMRKRRRTWFMGNLQWTVQGVLIILLEMYCMNVMLHLVQKGVYTIGSAVLVQAYIAGLLSYMWNFGRSLTKVRTSFADAHEMAELLEGEAVEPIHRTDPAVEEKVPLHNGVTLSSVTFSYSDSVTALNDFSFSFLPGRRYGIVGKTGSGKSTLTKLILKAYDHCEGDIHVGNFPIDTIDRLQLRSWIAYVPQDPQFPSWTIREIIGLGNPMATDAMIRAAAEKACCEFIWEKLPDGFNTVVGERGVRLSGGERQRVAIAAAILKDAPIVIMDEPTSALDASTEQTIQEAIATHFKGKTLIVIAHRLSTVAILDEIVLIENGTIKNVGSHEVLLHTSTDYKTMWELQTMPNVAS